MQVELTKEMFCTLMDTVEDYYHTLESLEKSLGVVITTENNKLIVLIDTIVEFLSDIMGLPNNDVYEDDISYYCWETKFGKKWYEGMITENGVNIPLRNSEDLWNMIMLEKEKKEFFNIKER